MVRVIHYWMQNWQLLVNYDVLAFERGENDET